MKDFRIVSASLNTTPLDFLGNLNLHLSILNDASLENASIILFPELSLTGYGCEDAFYRPWVWETAEESLQEILPLTKNRLIAVGLPLFISPYLYNVAAILHNGEILGYVPKRNLANTGIHYEKRWFTEWDSEVREYKGIPVGDLLFDWNDLKIGLEICEDSWVLHRPSKVLTELGADIILSPGASHFAFGKYRVRSGIFQESSRVQSNVFVFSNLIGNESGRSIYDGGNLIASSGSILAIGKRLPMESTTYTTAELNLDDIRRNRVKFFRKSRNAFHSSASSHEYENRWRVIPVTDSPFREGLILSQAYEKFPEENNFQDFTSAVILGLFDYLRKSRTKGFTLSLSGGADSSALAILTTIMEKEAKKSLGEEKWNELGFSNPILSTLYQKTKNNSENTASIARNLSRELGANHREITIDEEVDLMVDRISNAIGRQLNWKEDDIPLQNIQARVRSPLVWLLANTEGHLLLSTGNRSEAAVGYTTMDGDSSGSISPIAGVSKKFLLEWLHWVGMGEEKRTRGISELASLRDLLDTKPSAELKPLEEGQEDEKDLMPYNILQKIEYMGIYEGKKKSEILKSLLAEHDAYSPHELGQMVDRFFRLFGISQWKRERLPISFHLDEYGLDPKTSYRYPILSGSIPD